MFIQVSNINDGLRTIIIQPTHHNITAYLPIPILCEIEAQIFFIESIESRYLPTLFLIAWTLIIIF